MIDTYSIFKNIWKIETQFKFMFSFMNVRIPDDLYPVNGVCKNTVFGLTDGIFMSHIACCYE